MKKYVSPGSSCEDEGQEGPHSHLIEAGTPTIMEARLRRWEEERGGRPTPPPPRGGLKSTKRRVTSPGRKSGWNTVDLNPIQREIIRILGDDTRLSTCWKTFVIKKRFGPLTPFLTFPGPRVVCDLIYSRRTKKQELADTRRDWVMKNREGYDTYRIRTDIFQRDPEVIMEDLVSFLKDRGEQRMESDIGGWQRDILEYDGPWSAHTDMSDADEDFCISSSPEGSRLWRSFLSVIDDPKK